MGWSRRLTKRWLTGDFGSTSFHALELGYRYRMGMLGPVRPFITASLGGVRGSAGDRAMQSGTRLGAAGRAGFGVEIPFGSEKPNGDFLDDAHLIGVNLGVGVRL